MSRCLLPLLFLATTLPLVAQTTHRVPEQFATIQAAIAQCQNGDTVLVGPGTYPESLDLMGLAITLKSCQGPRRTQIGPSLFSLLRCTSGEGASTVVDGFRLYDGTGSRNGGGLYCVNSSPTIQNCIFNACRAGRGTNGGQCQDGGDGGLGGGAYVQDGSPTFINCFFSECRPGNGGSGGPSGPFCSAGSSGDPGDGGALYLRGLTGTCAPLFVNCTIWNNPFVAGAQGFDLFALDASPHFVNCIMQSFWSGVSGFMVAQGTSVVTVESSRIQGFWPGMGNISTPVTLVAGSHGEWVQTATSPCIDAGNPMPPAVLAFDFENDDRVLGLGIDMGADEFFDVLTRGSQEDLVMTTTVDGCQDPGHTRKFASAGAQLVMSLETPGGTFVGASPVLAGQFAPPATGPFSAAPLFLHLDASAVVLIDGLAAGPLGPWGLAPAGLEAWFTIPTGLAGTTLRIQCLAFSSLAANGVFATTDAHDLVFVP